MRVQVEAKALGDALRTEGHSPSTCQGEERDGHFSLMGLIPISLENETSPWRKGEMKSV